MQNKLWTKDFTTITLGSVVSMMGNSIAGFAMSLFVLDYMESTLLYAIYIFLYTLPQIAAPIISGPLMDRFSGFLFRNNLYSSCGAHLLRLFQFRNLRGGNLYNRHHKQRLYGRF